MIATSYPHLLAIDYIDFDGFNPTLAKDITHNPDEMLTAFSDAVVSILAENHPGMPTKSR